MLSAMESADGGEFPELGVGVIAEAASAMPHVQPHRALRTAPGAASHWDASPTCRSAKQLASLAA